MKIAFRQSNFRIFKYRKLFQKDNIWIRLVFHVYGRMKQRYCTVIFSNYANKGYSSRSLFTLRSKFYVDQIYMSQYSSLFLHLEIIHQLIISSCWYILWFSIYSLIVPRCIRSIFAFAIHMMLRLISHLMDRLKIQVTLKHRNNQLCSYL
jgi:hypothetical protein